MDFGTFLLLVVSLLVIADLALTYYVFTTADSAIGEISAVQDRLQKFVADHEFKLQNNSDLAAKRIEEVAKEIAKLKKRNVELGNSLLDLRSAVAVKEAKRSVKSADKKKGNK